MLGVKRRPKTRSLGSFSNLPNRGVVLLIFMLAFKYLFHSPIAFFKTKLNELCNKGASSKGKTLETLNG